MNRGTTGATDLEARLREVRAPQPVMERDRERRLTERQRQILDELGTLFEGGFADLTMADLAAQLNCSLRTLYGLAPSRDELVLTVVDRNVRKVGRSAIAAIQRDMAPLDAVRAYLRAATVAVGTLTEEFARDLADMPAGRRLNREHSDYLVAITRCLLDLAVERGDIGDVDTAAVARVIAGLGGDFAAPEVMPTLRSSPKEAADAVVEIVLSGLRTTAI